MSPNTASDLDLRDELAILRYEQHRNAGYVHPRAVELVASQYGYALHEVEALTEWSPTHPGRALESRYWTLGIVILVLMAILFGVGLLVGAL